MSSKNVGKIYAFAHIQKAAGTTMLSILRRNFGLRHMDVSPRLGWLYTQQDLAADLRLNPFVKSISSHWLRPFIDYGELNDRLVWYAIVREPIQRYISHYQHHIEKMNVTKDFATWMMINTQDNWQVQLLAGEQDLAAAKQIISNKFRCIGVLEKFNESLLLIRHHLGLKNFRVSYGRPRNPSKTGAVTRCIRKNLDEYRDRIIENNMLDIELYRFVVDNIYPKQVENYGAVHLIKDCEREFAQNKNNLSDGFREQINTFTRRAFYKPIVLTRGWIARRKGMVEILR